AHDARRSGVCRHELQCSPTLSQYAPRGARMTTRKRLHDLWLILCLALAGATALVDAAVSMSAVLITVLVLPPLLASARLSRWETALVALVCVALAVLLGIPDDIFGHVDNVL